MKIEIPSFPEIPARVNVAVFFFLMATLLINGIVVMRDFPWRGDPFKWLEARELYNSAMRDRMRFELPRAVLKLKQAISMYDSDARFYASLGDAQFRLNRYEDAQASFEKATQLDKHNTYAWTMLGRALAAEGKTEQAIKATHQAIDTSPMNVVANAQLGLLLASSGNLKEAAKIFDDSRSLERDKAEYWYLQGKYFFLLKKPQETEAAFRQAVAKDPHEPEYAEWLGFCLQSMNKPDEAEQEFEAACRLNPHSIDYQLALARLRVQLGHSDGAIDALRKALKEDPDNIESQTLLGMALVDAKQFAEAEAMLKPAIERNPKDDTVRDAYLQSLIGQHKLNSAEATVDEWLKNPEYKDAPAAWICLGQLYKMDGKEADANKAFEKALSLNPPDEIKKFIQERMKPATKEQAQDQAPTK